MPPTRAQSALGEKKPPGKFPRRLEWRVLGLLVCGGTLRFAHLCLFKKHNITHSKQIVISHGIF